MYSQNPAARSVTTSMANRATTPNRSLSQKASMTTGKRMLAVTMATNAVLR